MNQRPQSRDMSDDDSLFGKVKRAVSGRTAAERAAALRERASEDPASFDRDDVETLTELADANDADVVGDALGTLRTLAADRPELVGEATPAVVADLSNRPGDEWSDTRLREMDEEFLRDLDRGSILLTLATDDPAHLDPVVGELASKYAAEDALEPQSLLALAYVVAADPDRTDLSPGPFVEWVATELEATVEDDSDELAVQIAETTTYVELLADLGGERAREALRTVSEDHDDEAVVRAAEGALDRLSADT